MKLIALMKQHRYELISFLTGASVMMLEIVGARLIAPYFGTSTYVWTAMIGVILGALSLGFWLGGRMADKDRPVQDIVLILTIAAALVIAISLFQRPILGLIARQDLDLRISAIIAATLLFGPASLLIGMVSPHLAKIRVTSLKTTGAAVGRLEAAGALGSIAGTFASGYFLLAYFGAQKLSITLAILLVATSFLAGTKQYRVLRILLVVAALLLLVVPVREKGILYDKDSAYSRYLVKESIYKGRTARVLLMDKQSIQSGIFPDEPLEPVFDYVRQMFEATKTEHTEGRILMIGGGAYTLPNMLHDALPDTPIDVVEIDPELSAISTKFFAYRPNALVDEYYQDGRSYINRTQLRYNVILIDAFSSLTPPFHLTTIEAAERVKMLLGENGTVIINLPTRYDAGFASSLSETYRNVFANVDLYQANASIGIDEPQNFLLVAGATEPEIATRQVLGSSIAFPDGGFVLTDDYAPVERLTY